MLIFVISGIIATFTHDIVPSGPDIWVFLYGGLLNIWDTVLAMFLGGYLIRSYYHKKRRGK